VIVELSISQEDARAWEYFLRRRYGKKRAGLKTLIVIAVRQEVVAQARQEMDECGYHIAVAEKKEGK
jgi:hypothetical protein